MPKRTDDLHRRYAVVDVETTGGAAARHRIIEIAIVRVEKLKVKGAFSTLVHPERGIPRWIQELTGIRPGELEDAPTFSEVAPQVRRNLKEAVFVAHNAPFDYGFVRREFERLGECFKAERACTRNLARRCLHLPGYSLDVVTKALGVRVKNRHRALGDAMAAARVLIRLLQWPK
ncbi:MAG: 3'-5' exonuclease [Planctomycetota bacterium]|jgi:DNA polymerase-3 subunit epsilon